MRITILGSAFAVLLLLQVSAQAGDIAAGKAAFNSRGCIGCHGAGGQSPVGPSTPVVGGRPEGFIAGELERFRSGQRQDRSMGHMAASLSNADIANIAAYLAAE